MKVSLAMQEVITSRMVASAMVIGYFLLIFEGD